MPIFKVKKYIELDGSSPLVEWHGSLNEDGKAKFSARMDYLCACSSPAEGWELPYCRPLCDGIIEIRFKSRNVQQRPLGYFGPNIKDFSFLYPAIEKGDAFVPKGAVKSAIERKNIVAADSGRSNVWDIRVNE